MSKTPRTDGMARVLYGATEFVDARLSRQLETELADKEKQLAEARAEIERLALEIENKQYTITCASEENQQLKESLAEARTEIESKEKLVEQMRELLQLKNAILGHCRFVTYPPKKIIEKLKKIEAAIAAERGE